MKTHIIFGITVVMLIIVFMFGSSYYKGKQAEKIGFMAQENASLCHLDKRIVFHLGSWWKPLESLKGSISGMISNPPYIPTQMLTRLQPEVIGHEPSQALDGGEDGLEAIRYLAMTAPDYLEVGGVWLIEIMAGQGKAVKEILTQDGRYRNISIILDFAAIDRFVLAYLND